MREIGESAFSRSTRTAKQDGAIAARDGGGVNRVSVKSGDECEHAGLEHALPELAARAKLRRDVRHRLASAGVDDAHRAAAVEDQPAIAGVDMSNRIDRSGLPSLMHDDTNVK